MALLAYFTGVMKLFSVLLSVIGFGLCSCERHEWESETPKSSDTINLFKHEEGHDTKGEHHGEEGGKDHAKDGEHAKPEVEAPASE